MYKRLASSRIMRATQFLFVLAALAFMGWAVVAGLRELQMRSESLNFQLVGIGMGFVLIASLLGSVVWHSMMRSFHLTLPWRQNVIIHMTSNAAKYIPGYGWHYVSKGYLLSDTGAKVPSRFLVIVSEVVILISSGSVLGLTSMTVPSHSMLAYDNLRIWPVGTLLLVIFATLGWVGFVHHTVATTDHHLQSWRDRFLFTLWICVAWIVAGIGWIALSAAVLLFIKALDATTAATFLDGVIALTFSSIVSLAVIFVPAGLGVREVTMAALLAPSVSVSLAVTASIMLRLAVILCEILQLGVVLMWSKYWPMNMKKLLLPGRSKQNTPNGVL